MYARLRFYAFLKNSNYFRLVRCVPSCVGRPAFFTRPQIEATAQAQEAQRVSGLEKGVRGRTGTGPREQVQGHGYDHIQGCLLYTSPSPRD